MVNRLTNKKISGIVFAFLPAAKTISGFFIFLF